MGRSTEACRWETEASLHGQVTSLRSNLGGFPVARLSCSCVAVVASDCYGAIFANATRGSERTLGGVIRAITSIRGGDVGIPKHEAAKDRVEIALAVIHALDPRASGRVRVFLIRALPCSSTRTIRSLTSMVL